MGGLLADNIEETNINNLNIDIKIPYNANLDNASIGGVARAANSVNMQNSFVVTDINIPENSVVGGFFRQASDTTINNCKQEGTILGEDIGGIGVQLTDNSKIINSSSNGKLVGGNVAGLAHSAENIEIINSLALPLFRQQAVLLVWSLTQLY